MIDRGRKDSLRDEVTDEGREGVAGRGKSGGGDVGRSER